MLLKYGEVDVSLWCGKLDLGKDNIVLLHARVGKGRRQIHHSSEQHLNNSPTDRLFDESQIKSIVLVGVIEDYVK